MFTFSQQRTKALVALHGWSAIGLGLLLYAVVITGTVAVLSEAIAYWSIGAKPKDGFSFEMNIDQQISLLAPQVDEKYWEEISISETAKSNLSLFFHTHGTNSAGELDDLGVEFIVDPVTKKIIQRREGYFSDLFTTDRDTALSRFLVSIHTELHLPRPWGLLLTGVLGLSMLVAAISGLLMHRHLLLDAFVVRRTSSPLLKARDLHTVAGTWGLPFAFILAFTGSFFSFAGAFGIPAMAMVAFDGDQEALMHTLIGIPETESHEQWTTFSINTIIADAKNRAGYLPDSVSVLHYNRGDAKVILQLPAADGKLEPITYEYSGVSGGFLKQKPSLGTQNSVGSTAFTLIAPLHFGSFAGLLSKFVWVSLGIASCYTIASGLALWLRRREESSQWFKFERMAKVTILGLPICMLTSATGYFLTIGSGNPNYWVPRCFLIGAACVIVLGVVMRSLKKFQSTMLWVCGGLCILQPVLRLSSGGLGWSYASTTGQFVVILVDTMMIGFGALAIYCALVNRQRLIPSLPSHGATI